MILILNVLWLIFGGFFAGLAWLLVGVLSAISVIGLPWSRAAFNIGFFTLWPFGQTIVPREELTGREDLGTGPLGVLGNLVWVLVAGWWLALGHLAIALPLACTIIGIPFAWQHVKLAMLAFWPIGMEVVPVDVARQAERFTRWDRAGAWRR
jgi:uncharacterized membrane protein YccF (DUF307 family)